MIPLASNLIAKFVLTPLVVVVIGAGSLAIPKHYNIAHYPIGDYKGYHYSAKVMEHPGVSGISNSRVEQIKVTKDGKIVMDFYQGWRVLPKDKELINLISQLDKEMSEKHRHGWQGI
jgi:hypothetical protein